MNGKAKPGPLALWAAVFLLTVLGWPGAEAQGPNRVGLVVQFGDGSYTTRCVEFSEPQISGYDVLLRSGLDIKAAVSGAPGVLICGIEGEGCPASDCMCDFPPNYWSYWHLVDGEWLYSQLGASGYMVSPGDVEGWNWGEGHPPIAIPLEQICVPPATDTPPPTQTPTATSTPTATWTPLPPTATSTWTPLPTWTPSPTELPTAIPATATIAPSDTPWPSATAAPTADDTSTPVPPTATATPTWTPPPPTITPQKATETPAVASRETKLPPSATPSVGPSSPTPLPTHLVAATLPVTPGLTVTIPRPGRVETPQAASRLPALLALSAGLAYVFFILFAILLVALFVIVKVKQR